MVKTTTEKQFSKVFHVIEKNMPAKQIIKRIENCLDEEVRKIKLIYNNFSTCLFDADNQSSTIGDHQKIFEQIKDQMCSIFDLYDQLLYTIENYNHLREFINHKKLGNQCVILKRLLTKYSQILDHVAYRGEFGIKSVSIRTKLTEAIHELNLNSVLISEQPYVRNLNMFTIDKESIFRIKTDEIRFTFINYSDLDLDVISVRLIEDNNLNTIRTDDLLLSNLSAIDNQNYNGFSNHHLNNENSGNKIEWIAQNLHTKTNATKKKFKIRVIYLMNNQLKNTNSNLIKYRFQITAKWTRTQIESQFFTDKFCLIQDLDEEFTDLKLMKLRQQKYRRPANLEPTTSSSNSFDLSEFEFSQLDINDADDNQFISSPLSDSFRSVHEPNMNRLVDISNQFRETNRSSDEIVTDFKNNEKLNSKLNQCIKEIQTKFNSYNKSNGLFRLNDFERAVLKERLTNCGNFHLPADQLLNKELDYHCFSFNKYFKHASFCYDNLVDEKLREQIYGFLSREKVIELLKSSDECSYIITFSPSILCSLILNYLDDKNQLVELMFLEHNLRNNDLNAYLNDNCNYLKYPLLKNL